MDSRLKATKDRLIKVFGNGIKVISKRELRQIYIESTGNFSATSFCDFLERAEFEGLIKQPTAKNIMFAKDSVVVELD